MPNPQRIFITGANGFAGTYTCYLLLKKGYDVVALKRETSDLSTSKKIFSYLNQKHGSQIVFDSIGWRAGDVLDPNSLIDASKGCEAMVHLAASVSFQKNERAFILKNNIDGTANAVDACIENGIERFIQLSSVAALPNPDKKNELDENFLNSTFYQFETTYGESKYRSEMEIWRGLGEGLKVTALNPGIIIGPWKFAGSSVEMFKTVYNGLPFYSSGYTGFVDVQDVAEAVLLSFENEKSIGERFVLVSENMSYRDFLFEIADALGKKRPRISAGKNASQLVAVLAETWAVFTGKKAFITREMAQSANRKTHFVNDKSKNVLGLEYKNFNESIKETAEFLKGNLELLSLQESV
ncbi:MAG: NAD-dependent epimerase/dehydratase family protein [Bacteroidia bacterium]